MKKTRLLLLLLVLFLVIPFVNVNAANATTVITGTKSITVGSTTKIYIKLNTNDKIEGVDITYSITGNITVTKVQLGSGLTSIYNQGKRYALYAQNPIPSGSNILILTVKGTKVGSGTVNVTNIEATVSSSTVVGSTASYKITVKPSTTNSQVSDNNQDDNKNNAEEELKKSLEEATKLVALAETSLIESDYNNALNKVKELSDGLEKTSLLNRLEEVKIKIEVNKVCGEESTCTPCEKTNVSTTPWIVLTIILIVILVIESIILILKIKEKEE